jgi:hypothetical protein
MRTENKVIAIIAGYTVITVTVSLTIICYSFQGVCK